MLNLIYPYNLQVVLNNSCYRFFKKYFINANNPIVFFDTNVEYYFINDNNNLIEVGKYKKTSMYNYIFEFADIPKKDFYFYGFYPIMIEHNNGITVDILIDNKLNAVYTDCIYDFKIFSRFTCKI